jgi:hypothetical protein
MPTIALGIEVPPPLLAIANEVNRPEKSVLTLAIS